jgi:hypothetical protein
MLSFQKSETESTINNFVTYLYKRSLIVEIEITLFRVTTELPGINVKDSVYRVYSASSDNILLRIRKI